MISRLARKTRLALLAALVLSAASRSARSDEPTKTIKLATLAPEGSSWMKLLHEWATNVEKRAPGLKIRFFAGGVAGDERDVVRKMKLGQLSGAAVTAIGLGLIQPEVRVFEVPFMWKSAAEMDKVRAALDGDIKKKFEDKGYVLVNWGDVGPVHLFSNVEIKSKDDLVKMKMWQWSDDPLVRAMFAELGIRGVSLGVPDVLPSLQTGLIDATYGSPLSTLALQWNTKVKDMTGMTLSQSVGAQVITKKDWDALTPDQQKALAEEAKKLEEKLRAIVRDQDNQRALAKMKSLGLQVVDTPAPLVTEFERAAKVVAAKLDGQVYSHEFRARVEKLRDEVRAGAK